MKFVIPALIVALVSTTDPVSALDRKSRVSSEPVTLINAFIVPDGKEKEALLFWDRAADFMRTQPGYISTMLHQAVLPGTRFKLVNIAKWESIEAFTNASQALRTQSGIKPVDGVIPNPSLYTVVRSD